MHMNSNLVLYEGSINHFRSFAYEYDSEVHGAYGISLQEWTLLTRDGLWLAGETRTAVAVLEKLMSASLTLAGLGAIQLPAQYVAVAIARFCCSCNWLAASSFGSTYLDGAACIGQDTVESREVVSPERLFCLVLAIFDYGRVMGCDPSISADLSDQQVISDAGEVIKGATNGR